MLKSLATGSLLVVVALLAPVPAMACGDADMSTHGGACALSGGSVGVLVYAAPGGSRLLSDPDLAATLERTGHTHRVVTSRQELERALAEGSFDVLLADASQLDSLESTLSALPERPVVLPVVDKKDREGLEHAAQTYGTVLRSPVRAKQFLATLDRAAMGSPTPAR